MVAGCGAAHAWIRIYTVECLDNVVRRNPKARGLFSGDRAFEPLPDGPLRVVRLRYPRLKIAADYPLGYPVYL